MNNLIDQNLTKKGQEKLDEILEAAQKFFIENDSMGFTTTELAEYLNMTQANLYHYVQTKRELWFALALKSQFNIEEGLSKIADQKIDNFDKLLLMVKYFLDYVKKFPDLIFLQYRTSPPSSKNKGPFELKTIKEFNQANLNIVRSILTRGKESGEFNSDIDPENKVFFYWSLIYGATNFFMVPVLYNSLKQNGSIDYLTIKTVEKKEQDLIRIIEEDLAKYLARNKSI